MMGNNPLYELKKQLDQVYAKPDFSEEDGVLAGELGVTFEEMGGWTAESEAANLLSSLGISEDMHYSHMGDLDGKS